MPNTNPASDTSTPDSVSVTDNALRDLFGYNLKRAFNVIQADLNKTLKYFELRMITFTALVLIVENPGLRQSQLADMLAIERPNLVAIIDELEQRELITRDRVPSDRRAYSLKVTLAGRQLRDSAYSAVREHERVLLENVSKDERARIVTSMQLIESAGS